MDLSEIFNDSLGRVYENLPGFFDQFYQNFLSSSDEITHVFEGVDMTLQRRMLEDSFMLLINFSSSRVISDFFVELAAKHEKNTRIKPHHYDLWLEAMVETLKTHDSKFNNHVEIAWRYHLAGPIEVMKHYKGQ